MLSSPSTLNKVPLNSYSEKEMLLDKYHMSELRQLLIKYRGKEKYKENYLYFNESLINVCQAPEPNDIAWENMHYDEKTAMKRRFAANMLNMGILIGCFIVIFGITFLQKFFVEKAEEAEKEHQAGAEEKVRKVKMIAIFISALIVLFNKFGLAKLIHPIVQFPLIFNLVKKSIELSLKNRFPLDRSWLL